jgi:hypothetical protein
VNTAKALAVALLAIIAFGVIYKQTGNAPTRTPGASQSTRQDIGDAETAKAWARVVLSQLNYLRDPDSLVVEDASYWQPVRVTFHDWGEVEVSRVTFRAKNGFGGFSRDSCYVVWVPTEAKHYVYTPEMYAALLVTQSPGSPKAEVNADPDAKKRRHHHASD